MNKIVSELIAVVNYQDFSIKKRAELFNKYQIPVHVKHFIPAMYLKDYILLLCCCSDQRKPLTSFGHAQLVCMNRTVTEVKSGSNNQTYVGFNGSIIRFRSYVALDGEYRPYLSFHTDDNTVSFHNNIEWRYNRIKIPRDLYKKIDEWLIDFGYLK